jgi:hypothetical protein
VPEINVRGDGFHLELSLKVAQPPTATFTARCDVAWQTTDLLRFQAALHALLDDLSGVARLSTLEDQVELTIRLEKGKGTVQGRVEGHAIAALEFEGTTDQSFLKKTLAELRQVNAAYPVRA